MRYLALACDYDGTIATDNQVNATTIAALARLRASGRKVLLVTGRDLPLLKRDFPQLDIFDVIVAENGALLYHPSTGAEQPLGDAPSAVFIDTLRQRNVASLAVGRVIVATWERYESIVRETIRELGLDLEVILNKGAVMVLPSQINKASGLRVALHELGIAPKHVVGVGDAENDYDFLSICGCAVAVANALPMLKQRADIVMQRTRGDGVEELIEHIIAADNAGLSLPDWVKLPAASH